MDAQKHLTNIAIEEKWKGKRKYFRVHRLENETSHSFTYILYVICAMCNVHTQYSYTMCNHRQNMPNAIWRRANPHLQSSYSHILSSHHTRYTHQTREISKLRSISNVQCPMHSMHLYTLTNITHFE